MNYKRLSQVLRYAETTEDDFHKLLDENPEDHHTRLVFADWLQEHNDPRAEGYRALGQLKRRPEAMVTGDIDRDIKNTKHFYGNAGATHHWDNADRYKHTLLHPNWFNLIPNDSKSTHWKYMDNRRIAEDSAALVFGQLPQERKDEILKGAQ